jgi:hypothetical protein
MRQLAGFSLLRGSLAASICVRTPCARIIRVRSGDRGSGSSWRAWNRGEVPCPDILSGNVKWSPFQRRNFCAAVTPGSGVSNGVIAHGQESFSHVLDFMDSFNLASFRQNLERPRETVYKVHRQQNPPSRRAGRLPRMSRWLCRAQGCWPGPRQRREGHLDRLSPPRQSRNGVRVPPPF